MNNSTKQRYIQLVIPPCSCPSLFLVLLIFLSSVVFVIQLLSENWKPQYYHKVAKEMLISENLMCMLVHLSGETSTSVCPFSVHCLSIYCFVAYFCETGCMTNEFLGQSTKEWAEAVFHKFYLVHSWILCPISQYVY